MTEYTNQYKETIEFCIISTLIVLYNTCIVCISWIESNLLLKSSNLVVFYVDN